jgi:hypothetical protein
MARCSQKCSGQSSSSKSNKNQRKKARTDAQCYRKAGAQGKVTHNTLYHVLQDDAQKESTKQYGNHCNFFGITILSGSGKQGYNIQV